MSIITLDFETYYTKDYSLTKLTYDAYIHDPRFEVIGVGVQLDDGEPKWFSGSMVETQQALDSLELPKHAVLMHNAMFDASILNFAFGIRPKIILDSLCMARALLGATVGGSLAKVAEYYGAGIKGEEVHNNIGLRREDFDKDRLRAYGQYCKNDVKLTKMVFNKMLRSFNGVELKLIDMTIRMYTEPKFIYDRDFLVDLLEGVRVRQKKLIDDLRLTPTDLRSNPKFAELLKAQGVEPPTKMNSKGVPAYAFAKTDEGMKDLLEHENENVQALVTARLGVKSSLEETRSLRLIETGDRCGGLIPIGLSYYGARSGRWSTCMSLQFQNLPNKSDLKRGVKVSSGYKVVGSDLSNIELRVGLWFAGQFDKLNALQGGLDLYKDFAATAFGVPYDEVTKEQRFIGKVSALSLVYGTGYKKLHEAIKAGSGVDIGELEAKRIVSVYREDYAEVANMWRQGGEAIQAVHDDAQTFFGYNDLCPVQGRKGILLPSGLHFTYPNLQRVRKDNGEQGLEWVYDKSIREKDRIYPAKCYQNIVQSLARCVLGEAMVAIHAKYPIALTVHDAVYLVVKEEVAEECLRFVDEQITTPPAWLPGIKLGSEGHISDNLKEV